MRENVGDVDVLEGGNVVVKEILVSWNVDEKGILMGKNVKKWD